MRGIILLKTRALIANPYKIHQFYPRGENKLMGLKH
jgi:hypothetical protein